MSGGNGIAGINMGSRSTPGSPHEQNRPNSFEVIGSAESLVGRVRNLFKLFARNVITDFYAMISCVHVCLLFFFLLLM